MHMKKEHHKKTCTKMEALAPRATNHCISPAWRHILTNELIIWGLYIDLYKNMQKTFWKHIWKQFYKSVNINFRKHLLFYFYLFFEYFIHAYNTFQLYSPPIPHQHFLGIHLISNLSSVTGRACSNENSCIYVYI